MRALIGHTGFVGNTLFQQSPFEATFNSKNFNEMRHQKFEEIVCAGISAVKWKANQDPAADRRAISALKDVLRETAADRFVLISTIDVYPLSQDANELTDIHGIKNHAYGSNRLDFEDFCRGHFPNCHVIRLPGLFGQGLRKNVIYDLLHDNCLDVINPESAFQYYNLELLTDDIRRMIRHEIHLLNLFTEPVETRTILDRFFKGKEVGQKAGPVARYNLGTAHANLWNRDGIYCYDRETILEDMEAFIRRARESAVT